MNEHDAQTYGRTTGLAGGTDSESASQPQGRSPDARKVVAGNLDLAVANTGSNNVSVLLNNGDGIFAADVLYGAGDQPRSVAVGDLDGDGDLDLAVANSISDDVLLHADGDCNGNTVPDECDLAGGTSDDCNTNGVPDECDIGVTLDPATGTFANDCNANAVPDECDPDADSDGLPDECDSCTGGAASGDTDGDLHVDSNDYIDFNACHQGPTGGLGTGCECFDFDSDGDVTLLDFAEFQRIFTPF